MITLSISSYSLHQSQVLVESVHGRNFFPIGFFAMRLIASSSSIFRAVHRFGWNFHALQLGAFIFSLAFSNERVLMLLTQKNILKVFPSGQACWSTRLRFGIHQFQLGSRATVPSGILYMLCTYSVHYWGFCVSYVIVTCGIDMSCIRRFMYLVYTCIFLYYIVSLIEPFGRAIVVFSGFPFSTSRGKKKKERRKEEKEN